MKITVAKSLLNRYPESIIAYLLAEVKVEEKHQYVETLKAELWERLTRLGITQTNLTEHPNINGWRQIYHDEFGVKPSKFRSSVEALVRRVIGGQGLWQVSSVVDLYNCVSVLTLLSIGAYDLRKIRGDIHLRYGHNGEVFLPLSSQEVIPVGEKQIVYADEEKVLCYLWNHRDSRLSAIDADTRHALFFIDTAFHPQTCSMQEALQTLSRHLTQIGGVELGSGLLNVNYPSVEV